LQQPTSCQNDSFDDSKIKEILDPIPPHHAGVLDVSAGSNIGIFGKGKYITVPPELNANGDSLPLLVALIAIASQPKSQSDCGQGATGLPGQSSYISL